MLRNGNISCFNILNNIFHKIKQIFHDFLVDEEARNESKFVGPLAKVNLQTLIIAVLLALLGLFVGLACVISALHRVHEGHVGKFSM